MASEIDVRIATYNIHRCRGMDRRVDPARIIEVLRDIDADVIALQEVIGAGLTGSGQAEEIGAGLGMGWVMNCVRTLRQHQFGNVVLSRYPIVHHSQYDLSWRTCESHDERQISPRKLATPQRFPPGFRFFLHRRVSHPHGSNSIGPPQMSGCPILRAFAKGGTYKFNSRLLTAPKSIPYGRARLLFRHAK